MFTLILKPVVEYCTALALAGILAFAVPGFAMANAEMQEIAQSGVSEEIGNNAEGASLHSEETADPELIYESSVTEQTDESLLAGDADQGTSAVEEEKVDEDELEEVPGSATQEQSTAEKALPCPTTVNRSELGLNVETPIESVTEESKIEADESITHVQTAAKDGQIKVSKSVSVEDDATEENSAKSEAYYDCDAAAIVNHNEAEVSNEFVSIGNSGENAVEARKDVEGVNQETGDVHVIGNVLNVVNVNGINSEILAVVENFESASHLAMQLPGSTSAERAQTIVGGTCSSTAVYCESFSSFVLDSTNQATLDNSVAAIGNSGHNKIKSGKDTEDSTIKTGDVYVGVNVINIVNTTLINSVWRIIITNVYGDVKGDLVLPSAMELNEWFSVGTPASAGGQAAPIETTVIDLDIENDAVIDNNVVVVADSGNNKLLTDVDSGDDVKDSEIQAGEAVAAAKVNNAANITLVNTKWVLGIINILGKWSGLPENAPDGVAVQTGPLGMSFLAVGGMNGKKSAEYLSDMNEVVDVSENRVEIGINNDATIQNDVAAIAETGTNSIESGSDIERSGIQTGAAKALANIFNWANGVLANSDLFLGMINIFGNLEGRVVFGYSDLSVNQESVEIDGAVGASANHRIHAANLGNASSGEVVLEWHYDAEKLEVVNSDTAFALPQAGLAVFSLGNVPFSWQKDITITTTNVITLNDGETINTLAKIYGSGVESDAQNNEHASQLSIASDKDNSETSDDTSQLAEDNTNTQTDSSASAINSVRNVSSYVPPPALSVSKKNNALGTVAAGSNVEFLIKVQNTSSHKISNVILYDTLRGPGGQTLGDQVVELGDIESQKSLELQYALAIPLDMALGTYTNSAFVKGIGLGLGTVQSWTTNSSFIVGAPQDKKLVEEEKPEQEMDENEERQETEETEDVQVEVSEESQEDITAGDKTDSQSDKAQVLGAVRKNDGSNGSGGLWSQAVPMWESLPTIDILGGQAHEVEALNSWQTQAVGTLAAGQADNTRQLLSTVLVCLLIALGYAVANLKQRQSVVAGTFRRKSWIRELGSKLGIF